MLRRYRPRRRGVAAVETAAVSLIFVVPLLIEVWEIGQLVYAQQVVADAAREGARLAGQAYTISSAGVPTQVTVTGSSPSVTSTVYQYLYAAGLTQLVQSDVSVTFTFTAPTSGGVTPTQPYLGEKGEPFTVAVSVPWNKVRLINLGLMQPTAVQYTASWQMLIDDPFTVNATLPPW